MPPRRSARVHAASENTSLRMESGDSISNEVLLQNSQREHSSSIERPRRGQAHASLSGTLPVERRSRKRSLLFSGGIAVCGVIVAFLLHQANYYSLISLTQRLLSRETLMATSPDLNRTASMSTDFPPVMTMPEDTPRPTLNTASPLLSLLVLPFLPAVPIRKQPLRVTFSPSAESPQNPPMLSSVIILRTLFTIIEEAYQDSFFLSKVDTAWPPLQVTTWQIYIQSLVDFFSKQLPMLNASALLFLETSLGGEFSFTNSTPSLMMRKATSLPDLLHLLSTSLSYLTHLQAVQPSAAVSTADLPDGPATVRPYVDIAANEKMFKLPRLLFLSSSDMTSPFLYGCPEGSLQSTNASLLLCSSQDNLLLEILYERHLQKHTAAMLRRANAGNLKKTERVRLSSLRQLQAASFSDPTKKEEGMGDASKTPGDASKTPGDASKTPGDASKTLGDVPLASKISRKNPDTLEISDKLASATQSPRFSTERISEAVYDYVETHRDGGLAMAHNFAFFDPLEWEALSLVLPISVQIYEQLMYRLLNLVEIHFHSLFYPEENITAERATTGYISPSAGSNKTLSVAETLQALKEAMNIPHALLTFDDYRRAISILYAHSLTDVKTHVAVSPIDSFFQFDGNYSHGMYHAISDDYFIWNAPEAIPKGKDIQLYTTVGEYNNFQLIYHYGVFLPNNPWGPVWFARRISSLDPSSEEEVSTIFSTVKTWMEAKEKLPLWMLQKVHVPTNISFFYGNTSFTLKDAIIEEENKFLDGAEESHLNIPPSYPCDATVFYNTVHRQGVIRFHLEAKVGGFSVMTYVCLREMKFGEFHPLEREKAASKFFLDLCSVRTLQLQRMEAFLSTQEAAALQQSVAKLNFQKAIEEDLSAMKACISYFTHTLSTLEMLENQK